MSKRPRRLHHQVESRVDLLRLWQGEIRAGRLFLPITGNFGLYEPVVVRLTCDRWWLEIEAQVAAPHARSGGVLGVGLNLQLHEEQELAIRLFAETSSVEDLIRAKAHEAEARAAALQAEEQERSPSATEVGKARLRSLSEGQENGGFARAQASLRPRSFVPHLRRRQTTGQGESGVHSIVPAGFPSPQDLVKARVADSPEAVEHVVAQLKAYVDASRHKAPFELLGIPEDTLVTDGQLAFVGLRDLLQPPGLTATGHPSVSYWSEAAFEVLSRAWSLWSESARERELQQRRAESSGPKRLDEAGSRVRKPGESTH